MVVDERIAAEPIPARRDSDSPPERMRMDAAEPPVTIIRPSRGLVALNLRDLWRYRDLLYILAWCDVKVRYKQTAL